MLKYGEVNQLAVFGLRQLEHCPPHFTPVDFSLRTHEKTILDWIWEHLSGRFYFSDYYTKTDGGSISLSKRAAFEIAGEASMFALVIDQINSFDNEDLSF
jgi:hypothetical protein